MQSKGKAVLGAFRLVLFASAGWALLAHAAHAQFIQTPLLDQYIPPDSAGGQAAFQPGVTVATRARPLYESSGVTYGPFTIRPNLSENIGYDSNVTSTSKPQGSPVIETNASLAGDADLTPTRLRAELSVDNFQFPTQTEQDFTNWSALVGIQHDFGLDTGTAVYSHSALNEQPGGLDVPQLNRPLPFSIDDLDLSYRHVISNWFITPSFDVSYYNFGNTSVAYTPFTGNTSAGPASLQSYYNQSYQSHVLFTPQVTAGYELGERRSLVIVLRDAIASFTQAQLGIPNRNYNDFAVLAGLDYDTDAVIRFRMLAGYEQRTFTSNAYPTIRAPVVEGSAIWTPTGLTTVTATVGRRIEDSADDTTAGYVETFGQMQVDHEYQPNVILHANGGAYFTSYPGGSGQEYWSAGGGVTYLLSRDMQLGFRYDVSQRWSSGQNVFGTDAAYFGDNYTDHRVILQLTFRL